MADVLNPNSIEEKLAQFLRGCAGRPMRWGELDCGLWLADWIMARDGCADPAADLRGHYSTELECDDLIYPTPFPVIAGRLARNAGWRSAEPALGVIGVVISPQGEATGSIHAGAGWVFLADRGIVRTCAPLRMLGCWGPRCLL